MQVMCPTGNRLRRLSLPSARNHGRCRRRRSGLSLVARSSQGRTISKHGRGCQYPLCVPAVRARPAGHSLEVAPYPPAHSQALAPIGPSTLRFGAFGTAASDKPYRHLCESLQPDFSVARLGLPKSVRLAGHAGAAVPISSRPDIDGANHDRVRGRCACAEGYRRGRSG
jgi:hypothetical protein